MNNFTLIMYWVAILVFWGWTLFNPIHGIIIKWIYPKLKKPASNVPIHHITGTWKPQRYSPVGEEECDIDGFTLRENQYSGWDIMCNFPGIGNILVFPVNGFSRNWTKDIAKAEAEATLVNLRLLGAVPRQ